MLVLYRRAEILPEFMKQQEDSMIAEQKKSPLRLIAAVLLAVALLTGCGGSGRKKALQQMQLGQKYLTGQSYTEAVASFTEVIRLAPENITAYLGRAQAYEGLKQYDDAKADYTTAIEKADGQPYLQATAYAGRAEIFVTTGDDAAAKADYDKALEVLQRVELDGTDETFRQGIQNMLDYITQELAKLEPTENGVEETGTGSFQQIMDSIEVSGEYASSKRYVLVNDYDGDGKDEAFGYFGDLNTQDWSWLQWDKLHIYYISAEGDVTPVYTPEMSAADGSLVLCGRPTGCTSADTTDFSASYFTNGNRTFARFDITYLDDVGGGTATLTVVDGKPKMSFAPSDLTPTFDGFFIAEDYDGQKIYAENNGEFVYVGQVACSAMAGAFNDKNTPEAAWQKYESSVRQWMEQTEGYSPSTMTSRVVTGDYDGDGRQEAYAILEEPEDDMGTPWAHVYYISPNGYIIYVRGYAEDGFMYGYLRDDSPLSAGNQKFLLWELDAGGSGSSTLLFGVKDGVPYEPEISGSYQFFRQSGSGYTGTLSDFSQGFHDYIDKTLTFDAASGEFKEK